MTNSVDTALVVSAVNHPAIRMQFDTGALAMNEEDPAAVIATNRDLIGHIHISEPNLVPIGTIDTDHTKTAAAIRKVMPDSLVSIEMLTAKGDSSLPAIESALQFVKKVYGRECNTGVSG
jgi:sugar phosphate isomerase/epimerase